MPARKKAASALQDRRPERVAHHLVVVEPADGRVLPPAPAGLLRETVERWDSFWRSRMGQIVDLDSDLPGLVRWAHAYDEWIRATRALKRARVVRGSMGQPVISPLAGYSLQRSAELAALEKQYGMTPKSRLDLGLTGTQVELTVAKINEMVHGSRTAGQDAEADDLSVYEGEFRPA